MFDWLKSKSKFESATYSVEIHKGPGECVSVYYTELGHRVYFSGYWRQKQLNLEAPKDLAEQDRSHVVANLSEGLAGLGYDFVIYITCTPMPIPEEERQTAIAALREMGWEAVVDLASNRVDLKKLPNWTRPDKSSSQGNGSRVMRLLKSAHRLRTGIEIIAKSQGAMFDSD